MQVNLKPYTPQNKMVQPTQPMAQLMAQPDHNQVLPDCNPPHVPTRQPKMDTKAPVKLILYVLCVIIVI